MRQVTGSMMNVVKGMDQAMKAMDLEKVSSLSFSYTGHSNIFRLSIIGQDCGQG